MQDKFSSEPTLIQKFNNKIDEAFDFYSAEVKRLMMDNYSLNMKIKESIEKKKQLADKIC